MGFDNSLSVCVVADEDRRIENETTEVKTNSTNENTHTHIKRKVFDEVNMKS